jgi:hypothetical protein
MILGFNKHIQGEYNFDDLTTSFKFKLCVLQKLKVSPFNKWISLFFCISQTFLNSFGK